MGAIKAFNPAVSNHAVIRCVQHFIGVVLDLDEDRFGTPFCMHLHLYAAGLTREQVEAAILRPVVRASLAAGATRITIDEGVIVSDGKGLVVTVHPNTTPRWRQKSAFRNHSRKEQHRAYRKMNTREKRRPVNAL